MTCLRVRQGKLAHYRQSEKLGYFRFRPEVAVLSGPPESNRLAGSCSRLTKWKAAWGIRFSSASVNLMTYSYDQLLLPISAKAQLDALPQLLQQTLETSLSGLILHGSASSAGFEVERSDLDVLAIIDGQLTDQHRRTIGNGILEISSEPHPLEFSIVTEQDLQHWTHPCSHQFHYGEEQREAFSEGRFSPEAWVDEDLAAHVTMARARGVDLLGSYPVDRFPAVPKTDYLSAILSDFDWAKTQKEDLGQYLIANACRTMAYLDNGALLSKSEGVEWCRENDVEMSSVVEVVTTRLCLELGL